MALSALHGNQLGCTQFYNVLFQHNSNIGAHVLHIMKYHELMKFISTIVDVELGIVSYYI